MFGGLKKQWPKLKTMSTLNEWSKFPPDLPLDILVDNYVDYFVEYGGRSHSYLMPTQRETMRQGWLASNPNVSAVLDIAERYMLSTSDHISLPAVVLQHRYWWYYCMISEDPLNAALLNTWVEKPVIQARLMYWLAALHAVDGMLYWGIDVWSGQCPYPRTCNPVGRVNNTGLTDFIPATWYAVL